jgi:hypothetical protein
MVNTKTNAIFPTTASDAFADLLIMNHLSETIPLKVWLHFAIAALRAQDVYILTPYAIGVLSQHHAKIP